MGVTREQRIRATHEPQLEAARARVHALTLAYGAEFVALMAAEQEREPYTSAAYQPAAVLVRLSPAAAKLRDELQAATVRVTELEQALRRVIV